MKKHDVKEVQMQAVGDEKGSDSEASNLSHRGGDEDEDKNKQQARKLFMSLLSVYISVFLDIMGLSLAIPVLPYLIKSTAPSAAVLPQLDNFFVGIVLSVYSFAQAVGSITLGRLSDIIGRRPSVCP